MLDDLLGPRRGEWVAYLRARYQRSQGRSDPHSPHDDDGICHGIIPFGAVTVWQSQEAGRLARATARPLPARRLETDDTGLLLAVRRPFCRAEHQPLLVPEEWDPRKPLPSACGHGTYHLTLP